MTSRKAIATIGSGPMGPVLDLSGQTFRAYGERHGYDVVIGSGESHGRPPAWGKVPLIRGLLDLYETVLWIDSDAIVLDPSVDILTELQADDFQALVRQDYRGRTQPNTGVWLLQGDRAKGLLDAVWALDQFTDHPLWENAAFMVLMGYGDNGIPIGSEPAVSEWSVGTRWVPSTWNSHTSIDGFAADVRVRHYAGRSNTERVNRMTIDLAELRGDRLGVRRAQIAEVRRTNGAALTQAAVRAGKRAANRLRRSAGGSNAR